MKKLAYFSWCGDNGIGNECLYLGDFNSSGEEETPFEKEVSLDLVSDFLIDSKTLNTWIESLSAAQKKYEKHQGITVLPWKDFNFCFLQNKDYEEALDDETEYAWILETVDDVIYFKDTLLKGIENMKNNIIGLPIDNNNQK